MRLHRFSTTTLLLLLTLSLTATGCESKLRNLLDSYRPKRVEKNLNANSLYNDSLPKETSNDQEPNDSRADANPILLTDENRPVTGMLSSEHDVDWYKISSDVDQPITINLDASALDHNLDVTLYSYDGTPLRTVTSNASADAPAVLDNLSISRRPTYFSVQSSSNQPIKDLSYRIAFQRQLAQGPFEKEPNDRSIIATSLTIPETIEGNFDSPDDVDFFRIDPKTNKIAQVKVRAPEDAPLNLQLTSLVDPQSTNLAAKGEVLLETTLLPNEEFTLPYVNLDYAKGTHTASNTPIPAGLLVKLTPGSKTALTADGGENIVGTPIVSEKPYSISLAEVPPAPVNPNNAGGEFQREYEPNDVVAQRLTTKTGTIIGTLYGPNDVDRFEWTAPSTITGNSGQTAPLPQVGGAAGSQAPTAQAPGGQGQGIAGQGEPAQPATHPANIGAPKTAPLQPHEVAADAQEASAALAGALLDWGEVVPKPAPSPIFSVVARPSDKSASLRLTWSNQQTVVQESPMPGDPAKICGQTADNDTYQIAIQMKPVAPAPQQVPGAVGGQAGDQAPEPTPEPLSYSLTVDTYDTGNQESEPNDSFKTADRLIAGQARQGFLPTSDDIDIWAFQVPKEFDVVGAENAPKNGLGGVDKGTPTPVANVPVAAQAAPAAQQLAVANAPVAAPKGADVGATGDQPAEPAPAPPAGGNAVGEVPKPAQPPVAPGMFQQGEPTAQGVKPVADGQDDSEIKAALKTLDNPSTNHGKAPSVVAATQPTQVIRQPIPGTQNGAPLFRHVVITASSPSSDITLFVVDKNGATLALVNNQHLGQPETVELDLPPSLYFVKVSSKQASCDPYTIDFKVTK